MYSVQFRERVCGIHRLLACLQSWHQYLYTHKGSEMFWMHVGNTDMQQPGCCSLGFFPNMPIVCFRGGNIHCKILTAFPWKWRWLDREGISTCPGEHSSLIKLSELLKKKVGWIFCQDRYVAGGRKCWWLLQPEVDEERAVGKQMEFYKSQLMKPCPQKLPCFAVNHFLNKCTLALEGLVQTLRFPTKNS